MAVEFKTNEVIRYGETDIDRLLSQEKYSEIVLKVTFEIHSNKKQQRVMLLEPNYSVVSSDYAPQPQAAAGVVKANENPIQRANRWYTVMKSSGKTTTALAKDEKVSKGLISQHVALLAALPPMVVDYLKDGRDADLKKKISLRELQRLAAMQEAEAIPWFHARMSGAPMQDVMRLH